VLARLGESAKGGAPKSSIQSEHTQQHVPFLHQISWSTGADSEPVQLLLTDRASENRGDQVGDAVPAKESSDHNEKKGGCDGVLHKVSVAPAGDSGAKQSPLTALGLE
jgi:hypothetical protein